MWPMQCTACWCWWCCWSSCVHHLQVSIIIYEFDSFFRLQRARVELSASIIWGWSLDYVLCYSILYLCSIQFVRTLQTQCIVNEFEVYHSHSTRATIKNHFSKCISTEIHIVYICRLDAELNKLSRQITCSVKREFQYLPLDVLQKTAKSAPYNWVQKQIYVFLFICSLS